MICRTFNWVGLIVTTRRFCWVAWMFVAILTTADQAPATDRTWDNGAGTNEWVTPANWNPDGTPAPSDNLSIFGGNPQTTSSVSVGSGGSIRLNGTGVTASLSNFFVGNSGSGTLTIERGVLTSGYTVVGSSTGQTGVANLTGSSSAWNTQACYVGYGGTGSITISNGADATTEGNLLLGYLPGSSGAISLYGSGSTWTLSSTYYAAVGYSGTGSVDVIGGAVVTSGMVYMGSGPEGAGTVTLDGIGSTWNAGTSVLYAGYSGQGNLNVKGGAQVTSGPSYLGHLENSHGAGVVEGSGSVWNTGDNTLYVANCGTGSLNVSKGATVHCGGATVGYGGSAQGTVIVDGYGSEWRVDHSTSTASLTLGFLGTGTVTIRNRGKVYVDGVLTIGPLGTVNLSGGTLDIDTLGGEGRLNFTGGTLKVTAGSAIIGGSRPLGDSVTLNAGDLLSTSSGITIDPGATLRLYGADAQTTSLTNNGALYITSGGNVDASAGLTNRSFLSMTNGTITGSGGTVTNDYGATLQASGSIVRPLTNNGTLTLQGVLSLGGTISNAGLIEIGPAEALQIGAGSTNTGTVALSGGAVTGNTLLNAMSAVLRGHGSVSSSLTNMGGWIHANAPGSTLLLTNFGGNTGGGELRVDDGASLTVINSFSNEGLIALSGSAAVLSGGTITNQGTIQGIGRVANPVTNNGTLLAQGGVLKLAGAFTNTAGALTEIDDAATLFVTAGLSVNNGSVALRGGIFDNNGHPLTNAGAISGYGTLRTAGLTNNAGNDIGVGSGNLDVLGTVVNNGTVTIQGGCTTTFFHTVSGSGSFPGPGTVVFLGGFAPGLSPAAVSFGGNVVFTGSSRLQIELGGIEPGTQYDRVEAIGNAALDGMLQVSLINPPFRPAHGNQFTILTFGSRTGNFATSTGLDLGSRLQLVPQYTATSLVLTAAQGGSGTWNVNQNGVTSAPANWASGLPNGVGDVATFGSAITQPRTVTVDVPTTFGRIVFDNGHKYSLAGSSAVTLEVASGNAGVEVLTGSHEIGVPVIMNSDVTISGTGSLDLSGGISGTHALDVLSGSLTAKSIVVDTLSIGSGASVTISPITGDATKAVPEPSTFALLGVAALGLLGVAWRRRKRAA